MATCEVCGSDDTTEWNDQEGNTRARCETHLPDDVRQLRDA